MTDARYPRIGDSLVTAAAGLLAVLPLAGLVDRQGWLLPATGMALLVALVGLGSRRLGGNELVTILGQLLAAGWVLTAWFARDELYAGFPTPAALSHLAQLGADFAHVAATHAAPIPLTLGVQATLTAATGIVALTVDAIAVGRRAPAAAGLALVVPYLTAAANADAPLAVGYFAAAAAGWLVLLFRQGALRISRWSSLAPARTTPATEDVARRAHAGFAASGRRVGAVALLAALLVPALVPHVPARHLLEGLARGQAGDDARIGFATSLDVGRSLRAGDDEVVLRYTTTTLNPPPLRVVATTSYDPTTGWTAEQFEGASSIDLDLADSVTRTGETIAVTENRVRPPYVAAPPLVVDVDFGDTSWSVDAVTSDLRTAGAVADYGLGYLRPDLTPQLLRDGVDGRAGPDRLPSEPGLSPALRVDNASAGLARGLAERVTAEAATPYDEALAIQQWLRSTGGFTYSLEVAPPTDADGRPLELDPITSFLMTKQGYCVQFSSAMVMMARLRGIPARMAIGFLPGTFDGDGWVVHATDAHSWPELYFPGAGWVRFEPTPSSRTGAAPSWTVPLPSEPSAPSEPAPAATAPATADPQDGRPRDNLDQLGDGGEVVDLRSPAQKVVDWVLDVRHLTLVGLLLAMGGSLLLPVTAALLRRARRRSAADACESAEVRWRELLSRLDDLGVPPPPGATMRGLRRHYAGRVGLDESAEQDLAHVVATMEEVRYAPPDDRHPVAIGEQVRRIDRAVASTRSRRLRLRAFLAPGEAVRWWRDLGARLRARADGMADAISRSVRRR